MFYLNYEFDDTILLRFLKTVTKLNQTIETKNREEKTTSKVPVRLDTEREFDSYNASSYSSSIHGRSIHIS
jgi:hypothetical protein